MNRIRLVGTGAAAFLTCVSASAAQPIPVVNAGFEQPGAAPGTFPVGAPPGWQLHDPSGIVDNTLDAIGVVNPAGTTFFPGGVPEGANAGLVFISGDIGGGEVGFRQVTGAALQAGVRYTLRVQVGNIASGFGAPPFDQFYDLDGFPGYRVQLLAGGVLLAEDDNTLFGLIPEGEFRLSTVTAEVGPDHPALGQAIEIRLLSRNEAQSAEDPGIEVDFDDVRLDAAPTCRADFNGDDGIDDLDIAAFFLAFEQGDAPADVNGDDGIDDLDIAAFFEAFENGC